ncbi:hypothetical protein [Streptomyces sp. CA-253872]|uniref:hypothetical protein n=1 Tax=Streptomyces sp. CA-253872 TaxID=3240067 RepID=UPI003D8D08D7
MPQGGLGHLMGIAPSVLVTLLNPLEGEGLVERRRDDLTGLEEGCGTPASPDGDRRRA